MTAAMIISSNSSARGGDDYRGWIFTLASAVACVVGASLIFIDLVAKTILRKDVRILQNHKFLAGSLGLGSGVMVFSSFYNLLPEAKEQLSSNLSIFNNYPDAFVMIFFFSGVSLMVMLHWVIHKLGGHGDAEDAAFYLHQDDQRSGLGGGRRPSETHFGPYSSSQQHPQHFGFGSSDGNQSGDTDDDDEEEEEERYNDSEYVDDDVNSVLNNAFQQIGTTPASRIGDGHGPNHPYHTRYEHNDEDLNEEGPDEVEIVIANQGLPHQNAPSTAVGGGKTSTSAALGGSGEGMKQGNNSALHHHHSREFSDDYRLDYDDISGHTPRQYSWSSVSTRGQNPFSPSKKHKQSQSARGGAAGSGGSRNKTGNSHSKRQQRKQDRANNSIQGGTKNKIQETKNLDNHNKQEPATESTPLSKQYQPQSQRPLLPPLLPAPQLSHLHGSLAPIHPFAQAPPPFDPQQPQPNHVYQPFPAVDQRGFMYGSTTLGNDRISNHLFHPHNTNNSTNNSSTLLPSSPLQSSKHGHSSKSLQKSRSSLWRSSTGNQSRGGTTGGAGNGGRGGLNGIGGASPYASQHDNLDHLADDGEHVELTEIGIQTALTIAIHKFPEGLITFLSTTADPCLGLSVFTAIAVHNVIEGYLIAFPLFIGLQSRTKAFWLAAALGGFSQPLGALVGWFILRKVESLGWQVSATGAVYAMVAGMMASIVVNGMWPQAVKCAGRSTTKVVPASFFVGIFLMSACQAIMGTKC